MFLEEIQVTERPLQRSKLLKEIKVTYRDQSSLRISNLFTEIKVTYRDESYLHIGT